MCAGGGGEGGLPPRHLARTAPGLLRLGQYPSLLSPCPRPGLSPLCSPECEGSRWEQPQQVEGAVTGRSPGVVSGWLHPWPVRARCPWSPAGEGWARESGQEALGVLGGPQQGGAAQASLEAVGMEGTGLLERHPWVGSADSHGLS